MAGVTIPSSASWARKPSIRSKHTRACCTDAAPTTIEAPYRQQMVQPNQRSKRRLGIATCVLDQLVAQTEHPGRLTSPTRCGRGRSGRTC